MSIRSVLFFVTTFTVLGPRAAHADAEVLTPADAVASAATLVEDPTPSSEPHGRYMRTSAGPSLFYARERFEGERARLFAPGVSIELSYGRRFRRAHALHVDLSIDLGPPPRVLGEDDDVSQLDDVAFFKRIRLGMGGTRFFREDWGGFLTYGAGVDVMSISIEDDYVDLALYMGVGGYAQLGLGYEWRVGAACIGLALTARFEAVRSVDGDARMRGFSPVLLLTVSSSARRPSRRPAPVTPSPSATSSTSASTPPAAPAPSTTAPAMARARARTAATTTTNAVVTQPRAQSARTRAPRATRSVRSTPRWQRPSFSQ